MKTVPDGTIIDVELEPGDRPLELCPFCEATPELIHSWTACYTVKCTNSECEAEVTGDSAGNLRDAQGRRRFTNRGKKIDFQPAAHLAAAEDAIERWNRRP